MTKLSILKRYSEVISPYRFPEIWSRVKNDTNLFLDKYDKKKKGVD